MAAPVSLAKLVSALQFVEPGGSVRIDIETGDVLEESGTTASAAQSVVAHARPDRCRTVAVQLDEQEMARAFCESVAEPSERKRLETALASSQPLESFENALYRFGIAHAWFPFREARLGELAKQWLTGEGIPFVDDLS